MYKIVESWDWSGADDLNSRRPGLARASWNSANRTYSLAHGFNRAQVIQRLQQLIEENQDGNLALVAFDFPFSFPFESKGSIFLDQSASWDDFSATVFDSLQPNGLASQFYGSYANYGNGGFQDHFAHLYKGAYYGPNYVEAYRKTESNARDLGCPAASVFRLVQPMVGVQALAGIHVLRTVLLWCRESSHPLTIWPLGHLNRDGIWQVGSFNWKDQGICIVESYPRVSFTRAGINGKLALQTFGDEISIQDAITNLGSINGVIANHIEPNNRDERDALIVLIHLLSPAWFRNQLRSDLPVDYVHLDGIDGYEPVLQNIPPPINLTQLDHIEGHIFGV